jgi:hypothetical protein
LTISVKEKLAQLQRCASDAELNERSAHFEAQRLAEVATEAQKYAQASVDDANKAFDRIGRLSDRSEEAKEALDAYVEGLDS